MSGGHNPGNYIFLSSAFRGLEDLRGELLAVDPARVWGADNRPEFDTRTGLPRFAVMDSLVERLRSARAVVCVLSNRYGTSVFDDYERVESVSFLEVELCQAALFHNDVHVFALEPFHPDARLRGLLEVLERVRPGLIPRRALSKDRIIEEVKTAFAAKEVIQLVVLAAVTP